MAARKLLRGMLDLEGRNPPLNLFTRKAPFAATIKSVEKISGQRAPGETFHVTIDHGGSVPYWEGQCYGIVPPGENPRKPGAPLPNRLYSLASSRYGDSFDGKTASLCVRRSVYVDPLTGEVDSVKRGLCSNFLCDARAGAEVSVIGPFGKSMLLQEENPDASHIMVATGTGVAPFRGFLRRMFRDDVPSFRFGGLARLFVGVANSDSLLYHDEFLQYLRDFPENFKYDVALSREMQNKEGGKLYVQDKLEESCEDLMRILDGGGHIYFCGKKEMMPGIRDVFKRSCKHEDWDEKFAQLKRNKQWHVEVY